MIFKLFLQEDNFKVEDSLNFDNKDTGGGGASAKVSSVEGKEVDNVNCRCYNIQ